MTTPLDAARQKEALRQQMLLRALLHDARPAVVGGWMREAALAPQRFERGLKAYQANAGALAERALAAAFPVLQQLLGEESFAGLARAHWRQTPPTRGDMACWGDALPAFIEAAEQLREEPYLADVARLEWALHVAASAGDVGDASDAVPGIESLAAADPAHLFLQLAPGTAVLPSPHPIVSIWHAHQSSASEGDARFAAVRSAFAAQLGERALVWRQGFKPWVQAISAAEAAFVQAVQAGQSLASALSSSVLSRSGDEFDFSAWLVRALRERLLAAVRVQAPAV